MTRRCTLKDVAQAAGLTVNSVSRALRDMSDISEETKRRVRAVAASMGYVPNISAASLRSGRSKTVGIVYDNLLNPYYSIMVHHLNCSLARHGYGFLTVIETHGDKMSPDTLKDLTARSVDGIITFVEPTDEVLEQVHSSRIPVLVIGRHVADDFVDCIFTNDKQGGYLATEYLVEKGYKNVAFAAETLAISCARERIEGYKEAMSSHGLDTRIYVQQTSYSQMAHTLVKDGCDAIICFNDFIALEVLYALRAEGRDDVAVMGYDDIQHELKLPYQLTTIGYDKAQIADVAVEVLMHKIDSPSVKKKFTKVHDVSLVEGATTPTKCQ